MFYFNLPEFRIKIITISAVKNSRDLQSKSKESNTILSPIYLKLKNIEIK